MTLQSPPTQPTHQLAPTLFQASLSFETHRPKRRSVHIQPKRRTCRTWLPLHTLFLPCRRRNLHTQSCCSFSLLLRRFCLVRVERRNGLNDHLWRLGCRRPAGGLFNTSRTRARSHSTRSWRDRRVGRSTGCTTNVPSFDRGGILTRFFDNRFGLF